MYTPPTAEQFDFSSAAIAFNSSIPAGANGININDVTGVDTSRYTTDVSGPEWTMGQMGHVNRWVTAP